MTTIQAVGNILNLDRVDTDYIFHGEPLPQSPEKKKKKKHVGKGEKRSHSVLEQDGDRPMMERNARERACVAKLGVLMDSLAEKVPQEFKDTVVEELKAKTNRLPHRNSREVAISAALSYIGYLENQVDNYKKFLVVSGNEVSSSTLNTETILEQCVADSF